MENKENRENAGAAFHITIKDNETGEILEVNTDSVLAAWKKREDGEACLFYNNCSLGVSMAVMASALNTIKSEYTCLGEDAKRDFAAVVAEFDLVPYATNGPEVGT